jgi:hypothetical protein
MALSLFICLLGLLLWLLVDAARFPRLVEIGKVCFWVGLLAFLLTFKGCGGTWGIKGT